MASECSLCRLYRIAVEASKPRRGVSPAFREWHVIGYLLLASRGPLGRPLASRILGLGDTTVKTMIRRLRGLGVVQATGAGSRLDDVYLEAVNSLNLCSARGCIGFDVCTDSECSLSLILRLRDSFVSVGLSPVLILCCKGGIVAPGAPPDAVEVYGVGCGQCRGRSICLVVENATVIDIAKALYAVGRVLCG